MKALFLAFIFSTLAFALNVKTLQCQKVGEHCFDPQVGLYDPKDRDKAIDTKDSENTGSTYKRVQGVGSDGFFNQALMNCDKNKFYDVFCESSKK